MNYRKHLLSLTQICAICALVAGVTIIAAGRDSKKESKIRETGKYGQVVVVNKQRIEATGRANDQPAFLLSLTQDFQRNSKPELCVKVSYDVYESVKEGNLLGAWVDNNKCSLEQFNAYDPRYLNGVQKAGAIGLGCSVLVAIAAMTTRFFLPKPV